MQTQLLLLLFSKLFNLLKESSGSNDSYTHNPLAHEIIVSEVLANLFTILIHHIQNLNLSDSKNHKILLHENSLEVTLSNLSFERERQNRRIFSLSTPKSRKLDIEKDFE